MANSNFMLQEEGRLRHGVYSEQGEVVEEEGKVMEEEEEEEMELQHHGVCFRLYPNHQGRNILEKMCQCLAETCMQIMVLVSSLSTHVTYSRYWK